MNIRTWVTLALALLTPIVTVTLLCLNVGAGGGRILSLAGVLFLPFVLGAILAWAARRKLLLGWLVLLTIIAMAGHEAIGVYRAFYRTPAEGGQELIYRFLPQLGAMLALSALVTISLLLTRRRNQAEVRQQES
jgi:hypothetical protein